MTPVQIAALASGVLLLVSPIISRWVLSQSGKSAPTYREAIVNLAEVRSRLVLTKTLDDDQKKAIDVLTLALVDGSDL